MSYRMLIFSRKNIRNEISEDAKWDGNIKVLLLPWRQTASFFNVAYVIISDVVAGSLARWNWHVRALLRCFSMYNSDTYQRWGVPLRGGCRNECFHPLRHFFSIWRRTSVSLVNVSRREPGNYSWCPQGRNGGGRLWLLTDALRRESPSRWVLPVSRAPGNRPAVDYDLSSSLARDFGSWLWHYILAKTQNCFSSAKERGS